MGTGLVVSRGQAFDAVQQQPKLDLMAAVAGGTIGRRAGIGCAHVAIAGFEPARQRLQMLRKGTPNGLGRLGDCRREESQVDKNTDFDIRRVQILGVRRVVELCQCQNGRLELPPSQQAALARERRPDKPPGRSGPFIAVKQVLE